MAHHGLTGILLVGGASRRFGSPKALATYEGETLAARAWRTLGDVCDARIAVGKGADALDLPFEVVDDGSEVRAPLAGIVAGLHRAHSEISVVLPVDVPLVRAEDLARLADACADAATTQTGPLPCALRRTALPALEQRLAAGELALHAALAELDTRTVDAAPDTLANVNTPGDLDALELRIVPYRADHAPGYRRLVADTLAEFGFAADDELDPDLDDPAPIYAAIWIAELRGDVVGSIALRRLGAGELELKRMYLRTSLRGVGVGRRLLATALAWARADGASTIRLDTSERMEAARHLYETHGFVRTDALLPRQGQDRLVYELRL